MSSVGGLDAEKTKDTMDQLEFSIPVICVWGTSVTVAIFVNEWPIFIATVGALLACFLVLLMPSMLYFRLGVTSDFQAIPLHGIIIPNRLFMSITQTVGVIFFLGIVVQIIMIASGAQEFTNMYDRDE
jgi:hypothetical protein